MREITAEGTKFIYFTKKDVLLRNLKVNAETSAFLIPFMEEQLTTAEDIRPVYVHLPFSTSVNMTQYLHWNDDNDLEALDFKVECNAFVDADFEYSILTYYNETTCTSCKAVWHTLVVPPPGGPYFDAPNLYHKKVAQRPLLRCPQCNENFRIMVAKIFARSV